MESILFPTLLKNHLMKKLPHQVFLKFTTGILKPCKPLRLVRSDTFTLKNTNPYDTVPQQSLILRTMFNFNITANKNFLSKINVSYENINQIPKELGTSKYIDNRECVADEGIGWAGQPIFKRVHTVLPELFGNVNNITEELLNISIVPPVQDKNLPALEIKRTEARNHDIIFLMNQNVENNTRDNLTTEEIEKRRHEFSQLNSGTSGDNIFNYFTITNSYVKSYDPVNIFVRKGHKKTIICEPKRNENMNDPLFTQLGTGMTLGNRQFSICSNINYQRIAATVNIKKQESAVNATKLSKIPSLADRSGRAESKQNTMTDECVCPEIVMEVDRKNTKICGEAANNEQLITLKMKKKIQHKGKICAIDTKKKKHRRQTFLCAPIFFKDKIKNIKSKRELPKCPEPEKKVAPRVQICLPIIVDEIEAQSKKECIQEAEEVKSRKRTNVCKPIIHYGREISEVSIEKESCIKTKTKEEKSRHTKVCPPDITDQKASNVNKSIL